MLQKTGFNNGVGPRYDQQTRLKTLTRICAIQGDRSQAAFTLIQRINRRPVIDPGQFDLLETRPLACLDPKVRDPHWYCRAERALPCTGPCPLLTHTGICPGLQGLLHQSDVHGEHNREHERWTTIYETLLKPKIERHFSQSQRQRLTRSIQSLILLRSLNVPYGAGCPATGAPLDTILLLQLHDLCQGAGLMLWQEHSSPIFVVETDRRAFLDWVLARMLTFSTSAQREHTVGELLWTYLFADRHTLQNTPGYDSSSASVSPLLGREGVLFRSHDGRARLVIFESIWKMDRGRRTQRVMAQLPSGMGLGDVWLWEPAEPDDNDLRCLEMVMAHTQALQFATTPWVRDMLRQRQADLAEVAEQTVMACYRDGRIYSHLGVQYPEGPNLRASLLRLGQI